MLQEFQVLQCYSCHTFQVYQVKKATKWACKMCGEKQSLKKVFGRGTGADCRQHVQRLNTMRGESDQNKSSIHVQMYAEPDHQIPESHQTYTDTVVTSQSVTKWNTFVEPHHPNSNDDDDDDGNDDRYTTDAQRFKQARKRKRESKGGNYSRTGNAKWSEFSPAANTAYYGGLTDSDWDRKTSQLTFPEVPLQRQGCKAMENMSGLCYKESSQRREKWYSFEPDDSSSQESISSSFDETLAKRIKVETHPSGNMYEDRQSGQWNQKNNTEKNTKWDTFTESDISSQESQRDNFLGPDEVLRPDSRPYVTFDSKELNPSVFTKASHQENETVSRYAAHNVKNYSYSAGTNGDFSSESSLSLPKNSMSKWTGYLACEEMLNQSENDLNGVTGTPKQNVNDERYSNSKWAVYAGEDLNNSRRKQEENIHLPLSVNEDKFLLNDSSLVQTGNEVHNVVSLERSRYLKNISNQSNADSWKDNEKRKPLFTTGDLDDADLEL